MNWALQAAASVRRWQQVGSLVCCSVLLGLTLGGLQAAAQVKTLPGAEMRPTAPAMQELAQVPRQSGGSAAAATMPPGDPMSMIPPGADLHAPPIPLIFPTALDRPRQPGRPFIGLLRYHEDWGFLKDSANRTEFWDPLKYLALGPVDWYLSLGGETRQRFEIYNNFPFSSLAPSDEGGYYLMRYMLHGDLHMGQALRLFAEFKSAVVFEKDFVTGADKNELDVNQLFIDIKSRLGASGNLFTLRVGRQELHYGMGRLLTIREGPNNRQGWDGLRGILRLHRSQLEAFYALSVKDGPHVFDDPPSDDQMIWGVSYTTRPDFLPGTGIDVYYMGDALKDAFYFQGRGDEVRHSVGVRFFGGRGRLDWDMEAILQFGEHEDNAIWAYSLSIGGGYTVRELPASPRFTLGLDFVSGDRRELDPDLQTFRPIVFRGNYSGEAAFLQLSNLIKVHPGVDLHLRPDMYLYFDFPFFWRMSPQDGLYSPGGFLVAGPIPERQRVFSDPAGNLVVLPKIDQRYIGFQPSFQYIWQVTQYLMFSASYAHFFLGDFLEKAGRGDADFGAVWLTYKF